MLSADLISELDHEVQSVRKTLERIPEDKFLWKPHEKSMALGRLASHIAELPGWAAMTMETDSFDMAPEGQPPFQPANLNSREEIVALFDKNVAAARSALAKASDEHLQKDWSLMAGKQTMICVPRIGMLRSWIMNHMIHHRAQLGVYLRLNDIPVPSVYGPSADEGKMG